MPQVDFYHLESDLDVSRFICRVTSKAWRTTRLPIHIHACSSEQMTHLDQLLWTFRDISFLPHIILQQDTVLENVNTPITLGHSNTPPLSQSQILVNLDKKIPDWADNFVRIIEFVTADIVEVARDHFRQYRDRNYHIKNQKINIEAR